MALLVRAMDNYWENKSPGKCDNQKIHKRNSQLNCVFYASRPILKFPSSISYQIASK